VFAQLLFVLVLSLAGSADHNQVCNLEGTVRDGTHGGIPVAGAEVILHGELDGEKLALGKTVSDSQGHFVFYDLPDKPGLVFVPGANHGGVHYPGPRLRFLDVAAQSPVDLTVFDAVQSPSPLIAERYDLEMVVKSGVVEITETILVDNPTKTTFVGQHNGMFATTLSLSIPDGFERVTFADEFHGRRFKIIDGHVVTDIPWTPGKRQLKYSYKLPIEESSGTVQRELGLPCKQIRVRIEGMNDKGVECNLPVGPILDGESQQFESSAPILDAGFRLQLRFHGAPIRRISHARWYAVLLLVGLVAATIWITKRQRKNRTGNDSSIGLQHRAPAHANKNRRQRMKKIG
jgi:hypothetical protein